jgi:UDP-glucose:(heptosyl)LPS alpha-1,3-glucosyltransferase
VRERVRREMQLAPDACVWLTIGVQPKTKGLDRVLHALQYNPNATLLIVGLNGADKVSQQGVRMARQLGVSSRTIWLGHHEDIERITSASDVLMHPARYDTTGTVILEALINGLPVITTSACGYAQHVQAAGAGIVLEDPFDFRLFLTAINDMSDQGRCAEYSKRGIAYGKNSNLYRGRELAARMIVDLAQRNQEGRKATHSLSDLTAEIASSEKVITLPLR